jgi:hypothetical protein
VGDGGSRARLGPGLDRAVRDASPDRPGADAPAAIGWEGPLNRGDSLLPLTAVLRSWEDRFGARIIDVDFDDLRLLVERPPRTLEAAQRVAAE